MGNNLSTTSPNSMVKKEFDVDKKTFQMVFDKALRLSKTYQSQFLDPDFCEKITITSSKQLFKLPIEDVRKLYNKVEGNGDKTIGLNGLNIQLKQNSLADEKYLVDSLRGRLNDYFKGQKIRKGEKINGIDLKMPDIYYIERRVLNLLSEMKQNEKEKREMMGGFNGENNNNNNNNFRINSNNNNNVLELLNENENENENEEEENINIENEQVNRNQTKNNKKPSKNNSFIQSLQKEFNNIIYKPPNNTNKPIELPPNKKENLQKNNKNQNNIKEQPNEQKNTKNQTNKREQPTIQENRKNQNNRREQPIEQEERKNQNNRKEQPIERKNQTNKREQPIERKNQREERKNYSKVSTIDSDKYCLDDKQPCKLTKKQMCEKIVYHFVVRNNIIAAIVSALPFQNKDGDFNGSFTFERLKSLTEGKFCLPPYWSDIDEVDDEKRIENILRYINILDENQCKRENGYILKLSPKKIDELFNDNNLGRKYVEYTQKINIIYRDALLQLESVLDTLETNIDLNTAQLNEIGLKTRAILNELYTKTQFNYLLCILILLDFDFDKTKESVVKKQKRIASLMTGEIGGLVTKKI